MIPKSTADFMIAMLCFAYLEDNPEAKTYTALGYAIEKFDHFCDFYDITDIDESA